LRKIENITFEGVIDEEGEGKFSFVDGILYEKIEGTENKLKLHTYLNNNVAPSLILNDNVIEIGDRAFDSCKNIDLLYLNTDIKIGKNVFVNIDHLFKIYMYTIEGVGSYDYVMSDDFLNVHDNLIIEETSNNGLAIISACREALQPVIASSGSAPARRAS
jgi:hypothetical protein